MDGFVAPDILAELRRTDAEAAKKKSRLRINFGGADFAVLDLQDTGFTLGADAPAQMRGLVDIFDGTRHLSQCLVVQSEVDEDRVHFEFKRRTEARTTPASDYVVDAAAPVGYLTHQPVTS